MRNSRGFIVRTDAPHSLCVQIAHSLPKNSYIPGAKTNVSTIRRENRADSYTICAYSEVYDCAIRFCEELPGELKDPMVYSIMKIIATHPKNKYCGFPINHNILNLVDHHLLNAMVICKDREISYFIERIWNNWTSYWAKWVHPDLQLAFAEAIREAAHEWRGKRKAHFNHPPHVLSPSDY